MIEAPSRVERSLRQPGFVGRQDVWRALDAATERALRFDAPQFVTIVGALGMGKTRLVSDWGHGLTGQGRFRVVRARAELPVVGEHGLLVEPFALLAALLRDRFGITVEMDVATALQRFSSELQQVFGDRRVAEVAALLGRFLGFDLPESPLGHAIASRPEREAEIARAVLGRFLEEDARRQPLCLVIEDLHLADEPSLNVVEALASELGSAPMVVLATARPELLVRRPGWGRAEGSHVRVELAPLSALEMDLFIRSVLDASSLASGLCERAAIESGGNPFLLEQLLQLYQQHGILIAETQSTWGFDIDRAVTHAPELSPEALAESRLAALSPAERDILSRGAAFGGVFWAGGVIALGRLGAEPPDATVVFAPDPTIDEVRRVLQLLAERDHVVPLPASSIVGETEWSWSHPEERTLIASASDPELARHRQRFAAQWIEARSPLPRPSERHEQVAVLYEEGGDARRAGAAYLAAGDEARRRLRYERARALYMRGLRLLDLDDAVAKMEAYHRLGDVATRLGRVREALGHFHEMLRIAWRLDLPAKGGAAHARIGRLHRWCGDYPRALEHLDLAHLLFDLAADRPGIAATLDDIGRVHFLCGHPEQATAFHRGALTVREELGDEKGKALTLSWMGLIQQRAGDLAAAEEHFHRALTIARASRDPHAIVFTLIDLGALAREAGHLADALQTLDEARGLARQMGERLYECHINIEIADTLLAAGRCDDAIAAFRDARVLAEKFGARRLVAEVERGLADAHVLAGDSTRARAHAEAALEIAEAIGATTLTGAALRVLGTAVAHGAPGDPDRGGPREIFDRAVELLGAAGAELELGRALAAYADFEERTGRESAAFEMRAHAQGIWDRARATARPRTSAVPIEMASP